MEPLLEGLEKTSYREGNTRVKVFGKGFKKSDILNEALNQARVEETGLRIPKLLEVRKVDNRWAIVTEFVEGETLQSLMEAHPSSWRAIWSSLCCCKRRSRASARRC